MIASVDEGVAALDRGEVVGVPTDTVYGLAARADRPAAIRRIYELKQRPEGLELPVLAADEAQALALAADVAPAARKLMVACWPGALTIVVADRYGTTVGLRVPDDDIIRQLCRRCGPLATTSANLHGEPPLTTAAAVVAAFPDLVVIDGGSCEGAPSTVVDGTVDPPKILREGRIPPDDVLRIAAG